MAILSQLFWGVTVGALTSAFGFLAKAALFLGGLGGAGWWGLRWHRTRHLRRNAQGRPGKDGSPKQAGRRDDRRGDGTEGGNKDREG